jgi:hypothetical protein
MAIDTVTEPTLGDRIRERLAQGHGTSKVAADLKVGVGTVYRARNEPTWPGPKASTSQRTRNAAATRKATKNAPSDTQRHADSEDSDSLRVSILRVLDRNGKYASSESLLKELGNESRWRHTGRHSLNHLLHAMTKQGYIAMTVKNEGNTKDLRNIEIADKGLRLLQGLRGEHGPEAQRVAEVFEAGGDQVAPEAFDAMLGIGGELHSDVVIEPYDGRYPSMVTTQPVRSLPAEEAAKLKLPSDPDPDAVQVAPGTFLHHGLYLRGDSPSPGDPFAEAGLLDRQRFPILKALRSRQADAAEAQAKADKYLEAAILLQDTDPDMATNLEARASDAVASTTLTPIEAEYLAYAEETR